MFGRRMGPRRHKFWFPLVRLGAFFGAVVMSGNVLLQDTFSRADADSDSDPDRRTGFLGRSKRRLEKRLKAIERLFFGSSREAVEDSGGIHLADPELEPAQDFGPIGSSLPATIAAPELPPLLPVAWQDDPEPFASRLPVERSSLDYLQKMELIERFYRYGAPDPLADIGDALLSGPEALLDGALRCMLGLCPRSDTYSVRAEASAGITAKIFDIQMEHREGRIFSEFTANWMEREQRYFSRFADSGFDTVGVQEGTEDVDFRGLLRDQTKVLWDTVRKTYLSKYKFRGEERLREDAFHLGEWRGADFAVLPPLIAGYLWWRGVEKQVKLGDTWLRISVEPLSRWAPGKDDLIAGLSLEWGIKGFPVGLILSAGKYDGHAGLDFIGIGTSIGMVRKALGYQLADPSGASGRGW